MSGHTGKIKYVPGTYAKKRPSPAKLAQRYINEWERRPAKIEKQDDRQPMITPTICFSRKTGVGALEIADILAKKIGYRVVDHEIIEHTAKEKKLREKTVAIFDERYPGIRREFISGLCKEKSFVMSDYARHLASVVLSIAGLGSTIFVGRGTHLILPRDRVLAVRFVSSKEFRVKRLLGILHVNQQEAENILDQIDKEQRAFYQKVFGKQDASPYEFDLVINRDHIMKAEGAANIVEQAFNEKFYEEIDSPAK